MLQWYVLGVEVKCPWSRRVDPLMCQAYTQDGTVGIPEPEAVAAMASDKFKDKNEYRAALLEVSRDHGRNRSPCTRKSGGNPFSIYSLAVYSKCGLVSVDHRMNEANLQV
eukprot:4006781-Amphidinium_carterae.2